MPMPLNYARPEPPKKSNVVPALLCSIFSGPFAFISASVLTSNSLPESVKEVLSVATLIVVLGGSLLYACVVSKQLRPDAVLGTKVMVVIAVVAPILWGIGIVGFIYYALRRI